MNCTRDSHVVTNHLMVEVFETSAAGGKLQPKGSVTKGSETKGSETKGSVAGSDNTVTLQLFPEQRFQTITGFGGAFTKSTAYLLNQLSDESRAHVIEAYFGESGARYSLTRTHMNSCDFSLSNYSYAPVPHDLELSSFSVKEDEEDIIPLIKEALIASKEGFKIIASPWTAPPWMKDNQDWIGGKLQPKYYSTWALFFSKYLKAYQAHGIDIWAFTVENEPLGNGNNWESMHFTPEEMTDFVQNYLGPQLHAEGHVVKILGYDQNREHLKQWVDVMYQSHDAANYFDGTAIHWYASTYEVFPEALQYAHAKAPHKHLIQTEACVDAEVPRWQDDQWYWSQEATDWGWNWAPEADKKYHPKYVPVYRYARDIIGCLNNWVDGWVDWNMVLDRQGGPNWSENWCVAPVIVDPEKDQVYFTPLYYSLTHFSRFIRPGAVRIGFHNSHPQLLSTAVQNPDGSIAVILLNQSKEKKHITLSLAHDHATVAINAQAIQTVIIPAAEP